MSNPEAPTPPKRHYVPVLPMPRPDSLQNAKRANRQFIRNKKLSQKLDDLLGPADGDE